MSICTLWAVWAKACHVELTKCLSDVFLFAVRTQGTISKSEPLANTTPLCRIYVYI